MKKIILFLMLISIVMFSSVSVSFAEKVDSFQQIMNYLVTGDPFKKRMGGLVSNYEAKIFDREKCVAGWEYDNGSYVKVYWNNIDVNSITIQNKFDQRMDGSVYLKFISFSGHPFTMNVGTEDLLTKMRLLTRHIREGRSSKVSMVLGNPEMYDDERLINAVQLLYSKHCTGSKRKSAF